MSRATAVCAKLSLASDEALTFRQPLEFTTNGVGALPHAAYPDLRSGMIESGVKKQADRVAEMTFPVDAIIRTIEAVH